MNSSSAYLAIDIGEEAQRSAASPEEPQATQECNLAPGRTALRTYVETYPWQFVVHFMKTRVPVTAVRYRHEAPPTKSTCRRDHRAHDPRIRCDPVSAPYKYFQRLGTHLLTADEVQHRLLTGFYSYLRRLNGKDIFLFGAVEDYVKHGVPLAPHAGVFLGGLNKKRILSTHGSVESAIELAADHAGVALDYTGPSSTTIYDCAHDSEVARRKVSYLVKFLSHPDNGSDTWFASSSFMRRISQLSDMNSAVPLTTR